MENIIEIPEGYEARIEDNKVILEPKESEDERIRKSLIKSYTNQHPSNFPTVDGFTRKQILAWLEKQGEQKQWDFVKPVSEEDKLYLMPDEKDLANYAKTCKNEPKFKVGDWVVTIDGKVNQVKSVSDDGDAYTLDDGTYFSGSWKDMYHLWTIKDAKDGDVLVASDDSIFLFKCVTNCDCMCYAAFSTDNFIRLKEDYWEVSTAVHPSTKEQRDLLFQKIKEAGYEWDAEKKELKKIEQNLVWSEEDEISINEIIETLNIVQANRLRTQRTHYSKATIDKDIAFLKSLKERYTWKPSDEQMIALKKACDEHWEPDGLDPLYTLYQDLKKLK